jgi:GTP pyrophosphokinase
MHERDINIQIGRERLDRELKSAGAARNAETISDDAANWLCNEYHLDDLIDILAAIGADDLRPRAVVVKLFEYWQQRENPREHREIREEPEIPLPSVVLKQTTSADLEVAGVSGLLTRLANCCCPLPGDEIVGFISRGKGVIVHRGDCQNITRFRERDRERLIHVNWVGMNQPRYLAPIVITARDRPALIRDLATVITDCNINLVAVNSHSHSGHEQVIVTTTVEVSDLEQIQRLFTRLERVKDVLHVERDLGKSSKTPA